MFSNTFSGKRIFVTGHTGFKGSWLSLWLNMLGAEVCGYSNSVLPNPSHFSLLKLDTKLRHEIGDICDENRLSAILHDFKPDIVFHLAAQSIVNESLINPLQTIQANTLGSATILNVVRGVSTVCAVIMITSDKVYENNEWTWGYREIDKLGGKDPYSASKAAAEILISSMTRCYFSSSGKIVAVGRAGNVIGGGDWAPNRIVPDFVKSWLSQQLLSVRNPTATRPWQHVLEPLSGYLRLGQLALNGESFINNQAFNFGPSPQVSRTVGELLTELAEYWPKSRWKTEIKDNEINAREAGLLQLSSEKAASKLNWFSTWDFKDTVKHTANWYLEHALKTNFDAQSTGIEQIKLFSNANKIVGK